MPPPGEPRRIGYLYIGPALAVFAVFVLGPLGHAFWEVAVVNIGLASTVPFVGATVIAPREAACAGDATAAQPSLRTALPGAWPVVSVIGTPRPHSFWTGTKISARLARVVLQ